MAAFQITQPSTVTNVATNTLVLAGQQRNRGLELNVFGEPVDGVRLLGGVMFLDAVLTQTQGGLTDGWTAAGAPNVQLNIGGEWDLPFARGFTLDGRVVYTGQQYVNVASPRQSIPEWTRLDVGARYVVDNAMSPTGKPITIRFNVDNLLNSNYWAGVTNTNSMFQGAPRFFRLSTTFGF